MLRGVLKHLFHSPIEFIGPAQRIPNKLHGSSKNLCVGVEEKVTSQDVFGTLSSSDFNISRGGVEFELDEQGDYEGMSGSIEKIKTFLGNHEYEKAKTEFQEAQKWRRVPLYVYRLLLSYNAKTGDIKEAFRLYNDCKKRRYNIRSEIYTSLFNAAANCTKADVALPILEKVKFYLLESRKYRPNHFNLNSMLKAYGRHGDITTAIKIVHMLEQNKYKLKAQSYNHLLEACLSDRNSGLRFALIIWHHMLKRNIVPESYAVANILKCARDCSLGDVESVHDFINSLLSDNCGIEQGTVQEPITLGSQNGEVYQLEGTESDKQTTFTDDELKSEEYQNVGISKNAGNPHNQIEPKMEEESEVMCGQGEEPEQGKEVIPFAMCGTRKIGKVELPNLLLPKPQRGSVVRFDDFSTPLSRFMLFGGLGGIMDVIRLFEIKPNIYIFSLILCLVPSTREMDEEIIRLIKKYGIKPDVCFMNSLFNREISRGEKSTLEEYLHRLKCEKCKPDLVTFGTLAKSCESHETAMKFIELARTYGVRLNIAILGALLENAMKTHDMRYVQDIIRIAKEDNVQVDGRFVVALKKVVSDEKKLLSHMKKESG